MFRKKTIQRFLAVITAALFCALPSLFADSFEDNHNDGSLSDWTTTGQRNWSERNGYATPAHASGSSGFLIRNNQIGSDGILTVNITADQWNGQHGGVVFRWTSPDDFYFVAVQPGNQYSNSIRFCKNSLNAFEGEVISQGFSMGTTFDLKMEITGSTFNFFINGVFKGSITDSEHPSGQVGYAYSAQWNDYINFNSIGWNETNSSKKFLIITAASLYADAAVKAATDLYANDIASEGWEGTVLTVSPNSDDNPMFQWSTEASLKSEISNYFNNGYEGFVIIGSSDEIPLVKWHVTVTDDWYDPTDLYYADMGDWVDINNDGVYESFHADTATDDEGNYLPDKSRPASPSNEYYQADMLFGRIDAGPLSEDKDAEKAYVASYLNKIHSYREHGSQLTLEQFQRACAIVDDDWAGNGQAEMLAEAVPNVHIIYDLERSNEATHIEHLEAGYKFYMQLAHSGPSSTGFNAWEYGKTGKRDSSFTLETLENIETRVNYINLFSCLACDFEVPNFGAAYIFRELHTYNVTGSTGSWGPWLDNTYWSNLTEGMPIGEAFIDYFSRVNDSKPLSTKDASLPKALICGDPLLTYAAERSNKAPVITTDLRRVETGYNQAQIVGFSYSDPEGDDIVLSMDESEFPPNAGFSGGSFIWMPSEDLRGQEVPLTIIATDPVNRNSYTEHFSIYVSHFNDPQFESMSGWATLGNPVFGLEQKPTPFKVAQTRYIETNGSWGGISQTVAVEQNRYYRFSFSAANNLTSNEDDVSVIIPECEVLYPVVQKENEDELRTVTVIFFSGNHTQVEIRIVSGLSTAATSGKLFVAGARLKQCGDLVPGDIDFDGTVSSVDALQLQGYLNGTAPLTTAQLGAGDVSDDGVISVHDVNLIPLKYVGLISNLPYSLVVGDPNEDGIVDAADLSMVVDHISGINTLGAIPKIAADVNGDDSITTEDANLIQDYISGIITEFPFLKK